ncbi:MULTISPECIES: phytanoyl-CoA dioxygenase family protein [unclassified Ruegeria]|uniref:phytanoyl-CoA dioxygenase family protein n=1 Tax=unclassified Ruegeria TaxID=2625375 RepID=UPI00148993DC|nr:MULTISPECIES: phytanoyl-CoA dioxygenase family protein [unclassified Ruegeria]
MDVKNMKAARRLAVWLDESVGDLAAFRDEIEVETQRADWPFAVDVMSNIPVYDGAKVRTEAEAPLDLMAEWNAVFDQGPGVIVIKGGMEDLSVVDAATAIFEQIIETESATGSGGGDHFAKPGANDRVWNAAEKHCRAAPENFAAYYSSDAIALASRAWLGRGYQLTAQVNRVNPGGAAQTAHRDYHLGFMNPEQLATYPVQAHRMSPCLTLQGAIAHCDMPLESGPTMLLPYSQRYQAGYVAFHRPEFQTYFAEHHVQVPLEKGDVVFFNPAVMHGAGTNRSTDIQRMANLLQVGSAFGRSIESVDRSAMSLALYPVLQSMSGRMVANVIAASAEGYAFPTNLDRDPPVDGLIPLSQAEMMAAALEGGRSLKEWQTEVAAMNTRRQA